MSSSTTNTMPLTSGMEMASTPRGAIDGLTVYGWRMTFSWKAVVIAYFVPSAASTASINAVSLNGLNRQVTAPAASRRWRWPW